MIGVLAKVCSPHCTGGDAAMVVGLALATAIVLWAMGKYG